jgi:hypothetical protein
MHDPEVVAFDIRLPWPGDGYRRRDHRWARKTLVTVWHIEPHGEDALRGECRGTHWQWHVHHWQLQFPPLQDLRRRVLTRCAWCGGRSIKGDQVDLSHQWDGPKQPLWRGELGLFHHDCSSVQHAHGKCLCDDPLLSQGDYGRCAFCGKGRAWRQPPTIPDRYLASLPVGSRIPADKLDWLKAEWAKVRAEREASR